MEEKLSVCLQVLLFMQKVFSSKCTRTFVCLCQFKLRVQYHDRKLNLVTGQTKANLLKIDMGHATNEKIQVFWH